MYIQSNYSLEVPPLELQDFDMGASSASGALRWKAGLSGDIRTPFGDLLELGRPAPDPDGQPPDSKTGTEGLSNLLTPKMIETVPRTDGTV